MPFPLNVNLLLGVVAIVAVASTLLSMVALGWVTRKSRGRRLIEAGYTPPVTIFKPLKGLDEDLEENLRSFFRLDYPAYQLLFGVADEDDPAIAGGAGADGRVSRSRRQARRRLPGVRAQPEGREPGVDGPVPQARRDPDQRLERPGAALVPPRDGLLPGRAGRRAGDEPVRGRGRVPFRRGHGEPPAQRVHRRRAWRWRR